MLQDNGRQVGSYFKLPNPDLMAYFGRVKHGNYDDDPVTTPFAKGESTSTLLSEWVNHLHRLESRYPQLLQYEIEMMNKVGPMSVQFSLGDRVSTIQAYYTDVKGKFVEINPKAIKATISEWRSARGLSPRSSTHTIEKMKLSTNSGNPYFTKRRRAIELMHEVELYGVESDILQVINSRTWNTCAVLGWRGQEGGLSKDAVKQRVVWMFPLVVNIAELMVYQVGIEAVQKFNLIPAYVSMDAVDKHITKLFDTKGRKDVIMCTDFTSFDSHFNITLQNASKFVLEKLFADSAQMRTWLDVVYPIKYTIDLACQPDLIVSGSHGMGSGSGGTNFDESLAHRCLQYEAAIEQNQKLNTYSMCLGDDGVLSFPHLDPDKLIDSYSKHGLEMNKDKQLISSDQCIYLRRWHGRNYRVDGICVGVYPTMRALGRLRFQERYYDKWSAKMVALRQLSIIENIKFHPMREEFVDFCMKRDKFRLGIDIPGFLDQINVEAQKATAYMPDFLGYTKSQQLDKTSISDWWIVKYLKSISK